MTWKRFELQPHRDMNTQLGVDRASSLSIQCLQDGLQALCPSRPLASDLKFIFLPFLKKTWLLQKYHFSKRDIHLFIMAPAMSLQHPKSSSLPLGQCLFLVLEISQELPLPGAPQHFVLSCIPSWLRQSGLSSLLRWSQDTVGRQLYGLINLYMLFRLRYHSVLPSHPCLYLLGFQLPGAKCAQKFLSGKCQK